MRLTFILKVFVVMMMFACSGCQAKPVTYLYLIQHPAVLHKKIIQCNTTDLPECALVKQVEQDYSTLNSQRQENPELFGKMILSAQYELAQTQNQLISLKKDVSAKEKIASLQKDYQILSDKIKILLAVVSATSPE